jgi:Uma2 family endonuclease
MTTQEKIPAAEASAPEIPEYAPKTRKFTVAEYYRMAEVGILRPEERVELIEGEIIVMAPIGPGHSGEVNRLNHRFSHPDNDRFIVHVQNPVQFGDGSELEPDVALLRYRDDYYGTAHPTPADVLLAIEVADTSLEYDREIKAQVYGRAGVPETWIKNLPEDCIEQFTEPGPEGYGQHTIHHRGETLTPVSLPDLALLVDELLPPPPAAEETGEAEEEAGQ